MAHIRKRERPGRQTVYEVRYLDPAGNERSKSFKRKGDAERWLSGNEVAKQDGSWIEPERLKVRFDEWSEHFMATGLWKAKTRFDYEGLLRVLILPKFGPMSLGRIDQVAVKEWIAAMHKRGLSPYRIRNGYRLLSNMLKTAVEAGYLPRNVAEGVALPRIVEGDRTVLTAGEVSLFVREMPSERGYGVLVEVLAYGGLRWGEISALRRGRCELLRSRLLIAESLAEVNGRMIFQPTKTYERRYVRLPGRVVENLAGHLESVPAREFHPESRRMDCVTRVPACSSTRAPTPSQYRSTSGTGMSQQRCRSTGTSSPIAAISSQPRSTRCTPLPKRKPDGPARRSRPSLSAVHRGSPRAQTGPRNCGCRDEKHRFFVGRLSTSDGSQTGPRLAQHGCWGKYYL